MNFSTSNFGFSKIKIKKNTKCLNLLINLVQLFKYCISCGLIFLYSLVHSTILTFLFVKILFKVTTLVQSRDHFTRRIELTFCCWVGFFIWNIYSFPVFKIKHLDFYSFLLDLKGLFPGGHVFKHILYLL